jgi:hypothetical protein
VMNVVLQEDITGKTSMKWRSVQRFQVFLLNVGLNLNSQKWGTMQFIRV